MGDSSSLFCYRTAPLGNHVERGYERQSNKLLNEESEWQPVTKEPGDRGSPYAEIEEGKLDNPMKGMEGRKAGGPDDIPIDAIKTIICRAAKYIL